MPPLKLPKEAKAKGKGKGKQVLVDFSSLDSARASAPADWDRDDWLAEGDRQDDNGTRYQAGAKAARHVSNATVCYRVAALLNPADFDARYNAARAFQTLAADHLAPPECIQALETARSGYREALGVLVEGEDGAATARIDALFNLAQADVALFELLEDGAVTEADEDERKARLAKEARDLFNEVERLQRVEMERFFGQGELPKAEDDAAAADETVSVASGADTSVQAIQTTIVTPQLVIDTLLESIAFDISLHDSSLGSEPETQAQLRQSALDSFSRASALRSAIPGENAELDFELAHAQATLLTTFSPAEATAFIEHLVASSPSPRIELLSLLADHLVESLPVDGELSTALATLQTALQTYEHAASLLSNRLSPPRHIPSHHLPSLLSANLCARSHLHLVAYHLITRAHSLDRSSAAAAQVPLSQAEDHLRHAHTLALSASSAAKSSLAIVVSSNTGATKPPLAIVVSSNTGATKPPLAIARSAAATEPRTDWRTLSALRSSLFTLVRVRLRVDPTARGVDGERGGFWGLWSAVGLRRRGEAEVEVRRREVRWWRDEIEGDKVMEVMGTEEEAREVQWWESLAA